MGLSELQTQVVDTARGRMAGKPWFRGVCLDRLPEDAEIAQYGVDHTVEDIVLDTMSWDCPSMWGVELDSWVGQPRFGPAPHVSTGTPMDALSSDGEPEAIRQEQQDRSMYSHSAIERRSLAMHRLIAERIRQNPNLLEVAVANVRRWKEAARVPCPRYLSEWEEILNEGVERALAVATDPGESGARLRQSTPFAGILPPKERWEFLRKWNEDNSST